MWNGTAESLNASPATMNTMPTTSPADTLYGAAKARNNSPNCIVPANT